MDMVTGIGKKNARERKDRSVLYLCVSISVLQIRSSMPRFPGGLVVENLPARQETQVRSLVWDDPLEEGMATHSCFLAWRIPWAESLEGCRPEGGTESDRTEVTSWEQQ